MFTNFRKTAFHSVYIKKFDTKHGGQTRVMH